MSYSDRPRSLKEVSRAATVSRAITSVVPSYLRRDSVPDDLAHSKSVLVTLKLSSQSFLDSVVSEDASPKPLYVIRTTGTSTSILRADPWNGHTKTAEIKWPKVIPTKGKQRETLGVLVQMTDGRWQPGDAILKPGTMLSAPPRFHVPNSSQTLKWKRVGSSYWCTTSSVKGPIATFHPALEGVPPRIRVFETLQEKANSRVLMHNGVSLLLLDQLILTAMLMVTDVQDWMLVQKYEDTEGPSAPPPSAATTDSFDHPPQSAPASASQWRKILYGEPIFPKRYPANTRSVSTTDLLNTSVPHPTSAKQMAKILYGDPIYKSISPSPAPSVWDSDDEDEDDDIEAWRAQRGSFNPSPTSPSSPPVRVPSPSSESMHYPSTLHPPSHTYMDPSFYPENIPPVPQIPAQYAASISTSTRHDSTRSRITRELPPTPTSMSLPASPRSQSTPPRDAPDYGRRPSEPLFLATSSTALIHADPSPGRHSLSRSHSISSQSMRLRRELPTPPASPIDRSARQSTISTRSTRRGSSYSQRSLPIPPGSAPPLPPLPPRRKVEVEEEMWIDPWAPAAGGAREAPPPYEVARLSESPTSVSRVYHKRNSTSTTYQPS